MNSLDDSNLSDVWSPLFDVISPGLSRATFDEIVQFADIPPSLVSLGTIIYKLISILLRVEAILRVEVDDSHESIAKVQSWVDCCKTIIAYRNEIEQVIPDFFIEGRNSSKPPKFYSHNRNPLGTTLWYKVEDPNLTERYLLLQAYLCLSYYSARGLERVKGAIYHNARIEACLAVRNMARSELTSILRELPNTPISLNAYMDILKKWPFDRDACRLRALFTDVITGRRGITHLDRVSQKRSTSTTEHPFSNNVQVVSSAEEDDELHAARISVLSVLSLSVTALALQRNSLCSPNEFMSPRETLLIEHEGPDPSGGYDRVQYRLMARGYAAAMSMHNQKLANDWDRLTAQEIQHFLLLVSDFSTNDEDRIGKVSSCELAAFLAVMFWTSSVPEEVCNCTLVPAAASCTERIGIQYESNGPWNWVIRPRVPVLSLVSKQVLKDQAINPVPHYTLPIPPECMSAMEKYLSKIPLRTHESNIFTLPLSSYQLATTRFFKHLRTTTGGRQNERRISLHLHDLLARMPDSDITTAMAISGRNDPLGSVQLHYTATSVSHINECYHAACAEIRSDAGIEAITKDTVAETVSNEHVGSRYVPRRETVKQLVDDLQNAISAAKSEVVRDAHKMVDLHNAMTVYTAQMIGFATGYRNVRDPLLQAAEIDRESNFAVITDKDGEDFYNARIIWLPPCCVKQLDLYNAHLDLFYEWLFFYNQELFYHVREEAVTGRRIDRCTPSIFVIWKNKDNPLQPKVMKQLVSNVGYNLPGNANRHYLRTQLLARRCPVEIINAFMGHWSRGLEPWGRFSGLSPLDYRQELSHHLEKLLEEDGWEAKPGLEKLL